jgi:hypothetical protein
MASRHGAGERQAVSRRIMRVQKPVDFSYVNGYENSPQAKFFEEKINSAADLEVAVLFAHVFFQDLLWDLLTLRLRADTRPTRIPGFETLVGLTLAGSIFGLEREILDCLNRARNEVGHRIERAPSTIPSSDSAN